MRGILILSFNVLLAAGISQASVGGPSRVQPIRQQMIAHSLAMENISSRELTFAKQDFEGDLGEIYEYKTKSPFKAFVMSLAVPGLGEYYLGHKIKAGSFLAVDAVLWTGYFIYHGKGGDKEDEFKRYALDHYSSNIYLQWWDSVPDSIKNTYSHRLPVDDSGNPIHNHEYFENMINFRLGGMTSV